MDVVEAARAWADGWSKAWLAHDADAVAALYAPDARFRSEPFRDLRLGSAGARDYAAWAFADEEAVESCRFGEPFVAAGERACVEYWAVTRDRSGQTITLAGVSLLRFAPDGRVADQRDYWNTTEGRREPPDGWGG
jgi:ketosteroid isomerase-like protein